LNLPGFGEVYGEAQFNGTELTYTISGNYMLSELQSNLNYALNGIPLPQSRVSNAVQIVTGYLPQNQYGGYSGYGVYTTTDTLTVVIRKDFVSVVGTGSINGYLGQIEVEDGKISIDTNHTDAMFEITGTAKFGNLSQSLKIEGQPPLTISSAGYYPDTLTLNATGLSINATGLSECFIDGTPPKALDGAITASYPLSIENEPYKGQVGELLADVSLVCDRIEFVCTSDWNQNGIKAYNSSDPNKYAVFTSNGIVIPIADLDELSLFGSDLGGEISGTAVISEYQIELTLNVDGHLDNSYYGIKHDGKATVSVTLQRNAYAGSTFTVTIICDGKVITYNAMATGGISPQDGFNTYAEDYGQ
jgi:hypothetical protein